MTTKKTILFLLALLAGAGSIAQRFTFHPEIGLGVQRSKLQSNSIPEPYFSNFFDRGGTLGIGVEYNFKKTDKLYFKVQNFFSSSGVFQTTNEKPTVIDAIFGGNTFSSGDQFLLLGIGIKKDVLLNSIPKALYVVAGVDFGFYNNLDAWGGSSGAHYENTRYVLWERTSGKSFFPMVRLGVSHPILNRKKREILEFALTYHRAFSTIWEHTLTYDYSGPRYGSSNLQTAKFGSQMQTFLITISKEIRITKKKN